jgi:hypothetical protein
MRQLLRSGLVTFSLLVAACGPDAPSDGAVLEGQLGSLTGPAATDEADAGAHGAGKVAVCHIPPGNPANAHTVVVGAPAVRAHLRHGDSLGSCAGEDTDGGSDGGEACQPVGAACAVTSDCCSPLLACFEGVCGTKIN